jgi:murein DD-endopeptidase MepM/ murein hydrolase activator NlpD
MSCTPPVAARFGIALALTLLCSAVVPSMSGAQAIPPLPDSTGWGVHVLAVAKDPMGALWVGTYGQGIFRLPPHGTTWDRMRSDTMPGSISWDFVHGFGFGPRGEVWYGTVGNGWGVSQDGGVTWTNWTYRQLGPEWQYVAPDGIVVRGDTTWVGTADGVLMTIDDGAHWTALVDSIGPAARGPADTAIAILGNEYVRRIGLDRRGILLTTLKGNVRVWLGPAGWSTEPVASAAFMPHNRFLLNGMPWRGTTCGLRPVADTLPCLRRAPKTGDLPRLPKTLWFRRPIDRANNTTIDQTYRYGSTMGGNFQQHQGVEFNNPDGTPVMAIGAGKVVYAGPAEQGALTVAIRHDTTVAGPGGRLRVYSVYYHNSQLKVKVGQRVAAGQVISLVGNTGRATNDHLHLEVHAAPTEDVTLIVDSLQRFPGFTTNPELWIEPLPNTGLIAGQVFDAAGKPVPQARIYGIIKPDPVETPFSYAETYGDKAHSHPLYGEHFAVSDVPPDTLVLGTEIEGKKVFRRVIVEAGKLTWVVFRP